MIANTRRVSVVRNISQKLMLRKDCLRSKGAALDLNGPTRAR
jgi:hypothetical protein